MWDDLRAHTFGCEAEGNKRATLYSAIAIIIVNIINIIMVAYPLSTAAPSARRRAT
jgi:hypothetical protein